MSTEHNDELATLLGELHARADQPLDAWERQQLLDDLLVAEAVDLAFGLRHVTIVHGWLSPTDELEKLDPILNQANVFLADRCVRMVAAPFHCTITISGDDVDSTVDAVVSGLSSIVRASWRVIRSGRPA